MRVIHRQYIWHVDGAPFASKLYPHINPIPAEELAVVSDAWAAGARWVLLKVIVGGALVRIVHLGVDGSRQIIFADSYLLSTEELLHSGKNGGVLHAH